jgi:hypothetical protein
MQIETARAARMRLLLLSLPGLLLVGNVGCRSRPHAIRTTPVPAAPLAVQGYTPLHPSPAMSPAVARQHLKVSYDRARFQLDSRKPFFEVEVPLILRDGVPYVEASWSDRQVECKVDTGVIWTMWLQWLHLDTQQLNIPATQEWAGGSRSRGEYMLAPLISLGGYTVTNMPTIALEVAKPQSAEPVGGYPPLLGMMAFRGVILTIDYAHKRLVMRKPDYDITRQPHPSHSRLIHFHDTDPRVVLPGTLAGHKAKFMLDTGCNGMWVSSSFAHKYLSVVTIRATGRGVSGAPKSWPAVRNLPGTLVGLPFKAPLVYVEASAGGADVLVGAPFFKSYRVTVDQFRGAVLLEHY